MSHGNFIQFSSDTTATSSTDMLSSQQPQNPGQSQNTNPSSYPAGDAPNRNYPEGAINSSNQQNMQQNGQQNGQKNSHLPLTMLTASKFDEKDREEYFASRKGRESASSGAVNDNSTASSTASSAPSSTSGSTATNPSLQSPAQVHSPSNLANGASANVSANGSANTSPGSMTPDLSNTGANNSSGKTVCQNCQTTTTPLWRRDEHGNVLCNACGLFLKLHGKKRPISLKTDVIKSRNRSRNMNVPIKRLKGDNSPQTSACLHVLQTNTSPSLKTISPKIAPHGSPSLKATPKTGPHHKDLNNIDHMHLNTPRAHPNQHQLQQHQNYNGNGNGAVANNHVHHQHQQRQHQHWSAAGTNNNNVNGARSSPNSLPASRAVPSTPSTMFSYPGSPVLLPHQNQNLNHNQKAAHEQHMANSRSFASLTGTVTSSSPSGYYDANTASKNLPLPINHNHTHSHSHSQNSPAFGPSSDGNSSTTALPSFASLNAVAGSQSKSPGGGVSASSNQNGSNSQNSNGASKTPSSPHILTPLSRPHSPQGNNPHSTPNLTAALVNRVYGHHQHAPMTPQVMATTSALRMASNPQEGSMSEQLRPRSPMNGSLERIPPLNHIAASDHRSSMLLREQEMRGQQGKTTTDDPEVEIQKLKTRVSELEIVNDLYRSKVAQLEISEASARRSEATIRESELMLRKTVDELQQEIRALKKLVPGGAIDSMNGSVMPSTVASAVASAVPSGVPSAVPSTAPSGAASPEPNNGSSSVKMNLSQLTA